MHAHDTSLPPRLVEDLAAQLAPLLETHGLTAALRRDGTIEVRNPAAAATDPRGQILHPGLMQHITVRMRAGAPWWCWIWAERGAPPEVEPMVPVEQTAEAARRPAAVLRIGEPDGAAR